MQSRSEPHVPVAQVRAVVRSPIHSVVLYVHTVVW